MSAKAQPADPAQPIDPVQNAEDGGKAEDGEKSTVPPPSLQEQIIDEIKGLAQAMQELKDVQAAQGQTLQSIDQKLGSIDGKTG